MQIVGLQHRLLSFSVIRNPFDTLVSYFWWSFYGPEIAKMSLVLNDDGTQSVQIMGSEPAQKYEYSLGRTIMPMPHDSDTVLRIKFQQFLESKSNFAEKHEICGNKGNETILEWFSNLQKSFWCESIDKVIKYESLSNDFNNMCNTLNMSIKEIPKLKSNQRKANKHYNIYYNSFTKQLVGDAFNDIIKRFNYEF